MPEDNPSAAIFLVDDHAMVREGLAKVLTQAGFVICGEAGEIKGTLQHPGLASAGLVVVDLALGDESGVDLLWALQQRQIRSLVYSMHEESNIVRKALAAGAQGYVTKREVASCLVAAVHSILAGRQYISPRASAWLVRPPACQGDVLSEQQQQIYELLGDGLTNEEIALRVGVSPRTVESYCVRVMDKKNASGMKELRQRAITDRHKTRIV